MKTKLTIEIEDALRRKARRESKRFAFEVSVPSGICDFVTTKVDHMNHNLPHITCYEIKVSFSDYQYSDNGANFIGDENYYVMPQTLIDEIISKGAQSKFMNVGIIAYIGGKFYKRTEGTAMHPIKQLTIEQRFLLMDTMLMRSLHDKQ